MPLLDDTLCCPAFQDISPVSTVNYGMAGKRSAQNTFMQTAELQKYQVQLSILQVVFNHFTAYFRQRVCSFLAINLIAFGPTDRSVRTTINNIVPHKTGIGRIMTGHPNTQTTLPMTATLRIH